MNISKLEIISPTSLLMLKKMKTKTRKMTKSIHRILSLMKRITKMRRVLRR
jgi:hypothetical protein